MSERLNGGPFTLGFGQQTSFEYWWGDGDDRHLAYASAHPVNDVFGGTDFVSFDQRSFQDGNAYRYGVTVRNDSTEGLDPTPFELYATTP